MFNSSYNKGYTLLEVIVVTTIVLMITGIGSILYINFSRDSRDAQRVRILSDVRTALQSFKQFYRWNDGGELKSENIYPGYVRGSSPCATINANTDPTRCNSGGSVLNNNNLIAWLVNVSRYLTRIPTDPKTPADNCSFYYAVSGEKDAFILFTKLENTNSTLASSGKPPPKFNITTSGASGYNFTCCATASDGRCIRYRKIANPCSVSALNCATQGYNYWVNSP